MLYSYNCHFFSWSRTRQHSPRSKLVICGKLCLFYVTRLPVKRENLSEFTELITSFVWPHSWIAFIRLGETEHVELAFTAPTTAGTFREVQVCKFVCPLRDQSLNPNLSTSTDPSPSCTPPFLIHIPTSTLCFCSNIDLSLYLSLFSENPSPTLGSLQQSRLGSPPGRGQTDQNQSQVDQLSPTVTWWNVFSKPCLSCLGLSRWMLMSLTQRLSVNGIIYLPSSLLLSPEERSAHMCTGLLFIAGTCSK